MNYKILIFLFLFLFSCTTTNINKKIITILFVLNILFTFTIPLLGFFHKSVNFFETILLFLLNLIFYILIGVLFAIKNKKTSVNKTFYYHNEK